MSYLRTAQIISIVLFGVAALARPVDFHLSPDWVKKKSVENVQVWRNRKNSAQIISRVQFNLEKNLNVAPEYFGSFVKVLQAYHNFQLAPFGFKKWIVGEYGFHVMRGVGYLRLRGTYEAPSEATVYFDQTQVITGRQVDAITFYSENGSVESWAVDAVLNENGSRSPAGDGEVAKDDLRVAGDDEGPPPCIECEPYLNPPLAKTTKTVGDVLKHMGDRNEVCRGVKPSKRDWIGLAGAEPWSWKRTLKHQLQLATMRDEVLTCLKGIITSFVNSARSFVALGAHIAHGTKKFEHWIFHRHHAHVTETNAVESEESAGAYAESDVTAAGDIAAEKVSEMEERDGKAKKAENAIKGEASQAKHQLEQTLQGNLVDKTDDVLNVAVSEQMCKSIEERFEDVCRQLVLSPLGALPLDGLQGAMYSQSIGMVGESVGAVTQNGFAAEAADAIARHFLPKKSPDGLNMIPAEKMPAEAVKAAESHDLTWYVHPFTPSNLEIAKITYVKDGVTTNQIIYRVTKSGHDQIFFGTGNPSITAKLDELFDQKQAEIPNYNPLNPKNAVFLETEQGFYKRVNAADGVALTDGQAKTLSEKVAAGGPAFEKYITVVQAVGYRAVTERNLHDLFSKMNPVDPLNKAEVKDAGQAENLRVDALEKRESLLEDVNKLVLKTDDVLKSAYLTQLADVIHQDGSLPLMNSYERLTHELSKKSGSSFDERLSSLITDKIKRGFITNDEGRAAQDCLRSPEAKGECQNLILKLEPPK